MVTVTNTQQCMLNVIWSLKACMLFMFARMLTGTTNMKWIKAAALWVVIGWFAVEMALHTRSPTVHVIRGRRNRPEHPDPSPISSEYPRRISVHSLLLTNGVELWPTIKLLMLLLLLLQ